MGVVDRCCGRSTTCPGLVSRWGALTARLDRRTAISDVVDMERRAAPWVKFGGSVIVEAGSYGVGEGSSKDGLTHTNNSIHGICGERPVWGGVRAAGPLSWRMY